MDTQPTASVRIGESICAFDESGEILETVETHADGSPCWNDAGIADHRGVGGMDGYNLLHEALDAAEKCARAGGVVPVRLP